LTLLQSYGKPLPKLFRYTEQRSEIEYPFYIPSEAVIKSAMTTKIELCSVDEVAEGEAKRVETEGLQLAVFNLNGQFYVTDDLCTHGPGLLHEGYIDGDIVECNFHNGSFNIKTGEVVDPPCMIPVKTYRTVVEGDKVFIET
jgi:nitrite reductase/ring-hydroxylating ferredoxin subunit